MAIGDDFSVATNGDIRYTGTTANYTVIAFHRWLGDLMDDAQASGNDILDITDATATERSTDNIITLQSPFNIDDTAAQHLYDGSVIQSGGNEIYDGILVFANADTYLTILQNGNIVSPNFWTTGLNADATNGISHRFMLKVRTGGVDIDGRRIVGATREVGKTYSEFKINGTARGNNVLALTFATDLNNATAADTIKGWTTITNTEGYRLLDVDNNTANEPYYSEWNRDTYTINQLYERTKWLSRRATVESTGSLSGSHFALNDLNKGCAQSFANGVVPQYLTRVHMNLKKVGSPTGSLTAYVYAHGGSFGASSVPAGAALATSSNVDVSKLTTIYKETEIGFNTQHLMSASTNYVVSVQFPLGDASNYVQVEGADGGLHPGNQSFADADLAWTATASADLKFDVYASPKLYGLSGEVFRGITHQVTVDTPMGTFSNVEPIAWSTGMGQMLAINSTTAPTKLWMQLLTGSAPTDNQIITGSISVATASVNVTVTERTLSQPFGGASTGTALIGAYGIGVETADLSSNDKLTDLDGTLNLPPNTVTFTVSGLVIGEDRVLVGPASGGNLNTSQRTLGTNLTATNETEVVVTVAIPTDTPSAGTIRVELESGIYRRLAYGSFAGSTFTLALPDTGAGGIAIEVTAGLTFVRAAGSFLDDNFAVGMRFTSSGFTGGNNATKTIASISADGTTITVTNTAGLAQEASSGNERILTIGYDFTADTAVGANNVYISYIDKLATATSGSFTVVYASDRSLFIRVRDGASTPIKTFETTTTLGSAGGSATAIRTGDT